MTRRNVIATIGAFSPLVALALGLPSAAFTEVGDATDLPPGQATSGSGPLLGTFASLGDVDLYRIDITDAASFSAETSGGAGADTVLFLFDATGFAVAGNDDLSGGNSIAEYFSRLIGVAGLVNGTYLLSISRWPYFPVSAGGQMYSIDLVNEELVPNQGVAYPRWLFRSARNCHRSRYRTQKPAWTDYAHCSATGSHAASDRWGRW
jgi:hypothetical protein